MTRCISLLSFFILTLAVSAQRDNLLRNGSFEGNSGNSVTPEEWQNLGFPGETPPDVLNMEKNIFGVTQSPAEGINYLGMVTRTNGTYEAIAQELSAPLKKGNIYKFTGVSAMSMDWTSRGRISNKAEKITTPVVVRIWGMNEAYQRTELLLTTEVIDWTKWKAFEYEFKPEQPHEKLVIEAYYAGDEKYYGNVLLDDIKLMEAE